MKSGREDLPGAGPLRVRFSAGPFLQAWMFGYANPGRFVDTLREAPAPHWGLAGQTLRGLLDALLLYLPLALLGRSPSTPPYLSFLPAGRYYAAAAGFAPLVLLMQWLFLSALVHVVLRLLGRRSDIDLLLNLTGMAALVVGAFLVAWDWLYIALGFTSPAWLGISHLAIDLWGVFLTTLGLRRLLGVPVWLGLLLNALWIAGGLPLAILFMRAPV